MRAFPTLPAALAALFLALALAGCKDEERPRLQSAFEHPDGFWQDVRFPQGTGALDDAARQNLEQIANTGYATGYEPARVQTGVILHDGEAAQDGLNLYCSGHAPEAVLMDMKGVALHSWALPFDQVPSERTPTRRTQLTWRKVHLLPGGDLLVCYEGLGLARLDQDSNLLWYWDGAAHHDFEVENGIIYTLSREGRFLPYLENEAPVVEDALCQVDLKSGELIKRTSIYEALFQSRWSSFLLQNAKKGGDVLHNNSVERVPASVAARLPRVTDADWLLCFRDVNAIAILNLEQDKIVWMHQGPWAGPHSVSGLESGNLLIFDNMGQGGFTRLMEWDPISHKMPWIHAGSPPESFVSIFSGNVRRLANGNTLASLSCAGLAQEITPDGSVVWEFRSPHRAGRDRELVAVLFEVQRLDPETDLTWIKSGK
ncbi:MAG: arylsulfotransferase family protein [Planctomycetota bacterium]|nr:arylsulfotransferase family protein [Planctomycetota bacterium]